MSTQTCDCIRVTYQLVGEEPVTVEVGKRGTQTNGKNAFRVDNIDETSYFISWSGTEWTVYYQSGASTLQATLSEDTRCPFGTFTIEEGSIFEAFEVASCETETEIDRIINCYKLAVWSKQCEYSKCVLEYVNNLIFGVEVCKLQESLKEQKRALEILNCYDPRDIANNTTNYNTITYNTIKKLLNK